MTLDDWESLQACPGWSALRGYLRDYREQIKEAWAHGQTKNDQTAQIRCEVMSDLANLEWSDIERFYSNPIIGETQ